MFGSTLPAGPGFTAVTLTLAAAGKIWRPTSSARGTVTERLVRNLTPDWVLTMLPRGIVLVAVKSLFRNRTVPVDSDSSTRLPVTGKVWVASTSTSVVTAGTVLATGSGSVAVGLAMILSATGPIAVSRGAMVAVAVGKSRYAPTPPTTTANASTPAPTRSGVRSRPSRNERSPGAGRTRDPATRIGGVGSGSTGVSATTRAAGTAAGARCACCSGADGTAAVTGVDPATAAAAPAAAAPAAAVGVSSVTGVTTDVIVSSPVVVAPRGLRPPAPRVDRVAEVPAAAPATPAAAAPAAAAPATAAPVAVPVAASFASSSPVLEARSSAIDDSYSATVAKIGMPADAARARVAASPAMIDSRLPFSVASRASRRKLIRDVETRDPFGSTIAMRVPSEPRTRAAAVVISSSTSR